MQQALEIEFIKYQQELILIRRQLHALAQIGLQEFQTAQYIRNYINKHVKHAQIMISNQKCPTAIVATIPKQNASKTYLYRCQLDALPIKEQSGLEYSAKGQCHHACGHDAHMAVMLVAMKIISLNIDKLTQSIVFVFQPGQQGKGGAQILIKAYPKLLNNVDYCFALHLGNHLKVGQIGVHQNYVTANSNRFKGIVKGKSSHSMSPHQGIDANYIGCSLVTQLYSLKQRILSPNQQGTLNITKINGGTNIASIASLFIFQGSLRTCSLIGHKKIMSEIQKFSKNYCSSFGGEISLQFTPSNYRSVQNKQPAINIMKQALSKFCDNIISLEPSFAGQDFCQFSQKKPSCYIIIGSALEGSFDENGHSLYPLHSSYHKFDERCLKIALRVWLELSLSNFFNK